MIDFRNVDQWNIGNNEVKKAWLNGVLVWEKRDKTEPFYVENITNSDETLTIKGSDRNPIEIQSSLNGTSWVSQGTTSTATPITLTIIPGRKLYLRASTDRWGYDYWDYDQHGDYLHFVGGTRIQGVSRVGGNIMSLLRGSSFTGNETSFPANKSYIFFDLFLVNTALQDAHMLILPVTSLKESCYGNMFKGCTSLIEPPILPATTLTSACYEGMFEGCTSLVDTPVLPATTLTVYCYRHMFYGCTSLNHIRCLATNISATECVMSWVNGVAANGTFIKNPNMSSWPSGDSGIPSGWTIQDAA